MEIFPLTAFFEYAVFKDHIIFGEETVKRTFDKMDRRKFVIIVIKNETINRAGGYIYLPPIVVLIQNKLANVALIEIGFIDGTLVE